MFDPTSHTVAFYNRFLIPRFDPLNNLLHLYLLVDSVNKRLWELLVKESSDCNWLNTNQLDLKTMAKTFFVFFLSWHFQKFQKNFNWPENQFQNLFCPTEIIKYGGIVIFEYNPFFLIQINFRNPKRNWNCVIKKKFRMPS